MKKYKKGVTLVGDRTKELIFFLITKTLFCVMLLDPLYDILCENRAYFVEKLSPNQKIIKSDVEGDLRPPSMSLHEPFLLAL